jgi:hypothetical protein
MKIRTYVCEFRALGNPPPKKLLDLKSKWRYITALVGSIVWAGQISLVRGA